MCATNVRHQCAPSTLSTIARTLTVKAQRQTTSSMYILVILLLVPHDFSRAFKLASSLFEPAPTLALLALNAAANFAGSG
jgi:hypothetical protein